MVAAVWKDGSVAAGGANRRDGEGRNDVGAGSEHECDEKAALECASDLSRFPRQMRIIYSSAAGGAARNGAWHCRLG